METAANDADLLWSARGEVACRLHAPGDHDPRWAGDRWQPIPAASQNRHGRQYQCQFCAEGGGVIQHKSRGRQPHRYRA